MGKLGLCYTCGQDHCVCPPDGLGGTDNGQQVLGDNVRPLFSDRPTAAGLPPHPGVVKLLESLLAQAHVGNITALGFVAFTPQGQIENGLAGLSQYTAMIGALEDLKLRAIMAQWEQQGGRK